MAGITSWQLAGSYFPNIEGLNRSGRQWLQLKQALTADRIRLRVTNEFGRQPLTIDRLVVQSASEPTVPVTFAYQPRVTVLAGQRCWSDWLAVPVQAGSWLTVTLTAPIQSPHSLMQTKDQTLIKLATPTTERFFGFDALQVDRPTPARTLVFFGDSLTNQGYYSSALTRLWQRRWPDQWGLINAGISGNRFLRAGHSTSVWGPSFGASGLQRLTTLLTDQSVDGVICLTGVNDLVHPGTGSPLSELPTADELLAGFEQVRALAARLNVTLVLLTIPPFKGALIDQRLAWSPVKEAVRQNVNARLRLFPETIDLATFVAQATDPTRLAAVVDCGDQLHFSAAGGRRVAQFLMDQIVDRRLFGTDK